DTLEAKAAHPHTHAAAANESGTASGADGSADPCAAAAVWPDASPGGAAVQAALRARRSPLPPVATGRAQAASSAAGAQDQTPAIRQQRGVPTQSSHLDRALACRR